MQIEGDRFHLAIASNFQKHQANWTGNIHLILIIMLGDLTSWHSCDTYRQLKKKIHKFISAKSLILDISCTSCQQHTYSSSSLRCSSSCHQTTPTHSFDSQYDKWTFPSRVNNKVIQPRPYQSLSFQG